MIDILIVGIGGFIGAICRYLVGLIPLKEISVFPLKTFAVNVIGCIAIGIISVIATKNLFTDNEFILFFKTGFCGGFTTFSSFALETSDMIKNGHIGFAFLYVLLSILAGISIIFLIQYFFQN